MKAHKEYKQSGIIWFNEIPKHWDSGQLKFRLSNNDGGVWGDDAEDEGTIVLRSTEIDLEGSWRLDNPAIRLLSDVEIEKALLKAGDLLITKSSGSESHIGKTALVTTEVEALKACYSNFMQRIRPNNQVESRFLHYFMNSSLAREQYNYQSTTTTGLANLNSEIIGNLRIPFIPLTEQQAIADFLDRKTAQIDTLIEKKQRQIDLLQEQRTALINHAVTKGLNPKVKMKDSGVEWLGEIPSHWEVVKLKYIGKAFIGLTYNPENVTDEENGTLVYRASNVQDGKIVFDDNVYVKMEIPERLITKVGDILICVRSGSRDLIGKNALIDEKSAGHAFGAFMTVFRSDINYFLSYVFKSQLFKVQSGIFNTSTVNQLTQGNLYDFQVAIPPIDEQEEIIQFLNNELSQIDETVNRVSKQIELLQEYRTALISEAVTGKIDVRAVHE